jgi:NitT/TauT family transport system permease protein
VLLFSILFGLSMDYHVFLLSRVRERFRATGDNTEAVAWGLEHTGGLITSAAAVMVTVFGAFALGRLLPIKELGFGLAAAVGIPLGLFVGWNRLVSRLVDPSIQLLRPVPITAWLPFAIAVFGIYDASALFLIGLGAFYPIVVNTTHGVRDTNLLLLRAARMMGAGEATILTKVVFRSALPSIFTGLRLGIGIAWTAVIVAEMIAVKSGLGYVLWDAYYVGRMDICVATMLSVGLLGFVSDRLLQLLSRVVLKWRTLEAHA